MKSILLIGLISTLTLSACNKGSELSNTIESQTTSEQDTDEIKNLIEQYAESINNADSVLGSQLFAPTGEVTFIHPRGHEKGWAQINESIYSFFGDNFSTRRLKTFNEKITLYDNTAWVEFYWVFDATFRSNNAPIQTKGRETQIWRKLNKKWQIVHIHYSGMPVSGEQEGF